MTPEQRSLAAKVAVHAQLAQCEDWTARTATARQAFMDRFEREVDPEGRLDPVQRAKMADQARKSYFAKLALKSAMARSAKKAGAGP
jgi:hypothetical protein